ncbi:MAG: dTMP kinase [Chloroflexi bacterium RBG_13_51_18]|nr:MAG: dTMP kinase [Chloroflexi bacterium RBG_13_51_18]
MSLFITFEGGEGCGKSTQARLLYRRITKLAIPALLTYEPGGTDLGKRIKHLVKYSRITIDPLAETMLFNASRAQLIEDIIKPALEKGTVVICDRYTDSTTAYQGHGHGLDLSIVKTVNSMAAQGVVPDLTVLLDVPVEIGLERKKKIKPDRFQTQSWDFHKGVRAGFLKLAKAEPKRWLVIDATQNQETIAGIIWQRVSKLLPG